MTVSINPFMLPSLTHVQADLDDVDLDVVRPVLGRHRGDNDQEEEKHEEDDDDVVLACALFALLIWPILATRTRLTIVLIRRLDSPNPESNIKIGLFWECQF